MFFIFLTIILSSTDFYNIHTFKHRLTSFFGSKAKEQMNCNKNTQNLYPNQNSTKFYCVSSSSSSVNDDPVITVLTMSSNKVLIKALTD